MDSDGNVYTRNVLGKMLMNKEKFSLRKRLLVAKACDLIYHNLYLLLIHVLEHKVNQQWQKNVIQGRIGESYDNKSSYYYSIYYY